MTIRNSKNKTERKLKLYLIDRMAKMPLQQIKVVDICEDCEIHRSTFYHHYCDVYDLAEQIADDFFIELQHLSEDIIRKNQEYNEGASAFLDFLQENKQLTSAFLSCNMRSSFIKRYRDIMSKFVLDRVIVKYPEFEKINTRKQTLMIDYMMSGFILYILDFLESEKSFQPSDLEVLTSMCNHIIQMQIG
ncbi:MAG: TetR/AcrR family transcriptional regulator C-terminal domain-containing protein [Lachnospiraceae bacterium]|nr:TetR/AcrR family transcriptional regulator C-terminal domain-containing protein [Lachnospiraceae bacterium]